MDGYQISVPHCMNKLGYFLAIINMDIFAQIFKLCYIWFVDIDGDFKIQLEDLAPLLLEPGKLVVKTINGNSVTGKDLLKYFKV